MYTIGESVDRVLAQCLVAAVAASSMSADTSAALDASDAWLAGNVITLRGFIRADIDFWLSGWIMWSSLEI